MCGAWVERGDEGTRGHGPLLSTTSLPAAHLPRGKMCALAVWAEQASRWLAGSRANKTQKAGVCEGGSERGEGGQESCSYGGGTD